MLKSILIGIEKYAVQFHHDVQPFILLYKEIIKISRKTDYILQLIFFSKFFITLRTLFLSVFSMLYNITTSSFTRNPSKDLYFLCRVSGFLLPLFYFLVICLFIHYQILGKCEKFTFNIQKRNKLNYKKFLVIVKFEFEWEYLGNIGNLDMFMRTYFCRQSSWYLAKYQEAQRQFSAGGRPHLSTPICEYMPIHTY